MSADPDEREDAEHRQHPGERVEDRHVLTRLRQAFGVDDRDGAGHRRHAHVLEEREPGIDQLALHLLDHVAEVERDLAVLDVDRTRRLARVVGEERDELVVGAPVGGVPQVGELLRSEQLLGDVGGVALCRGRDRSGEDLRPLRERVGDALLDVDVREDGVHDDRGDGLLDVGVLGQRRDRLDVAVGVGELVVGPDRDSPTAARG